MKEWSKTELDMFDLTALLVKKHHLKLLDDLVKHLTGCPIKPDLVRLAVPIAQVKFSGVTGERCDKNS
jgi:hypothetical protein